MSVDQIEFDPPVVDLPTELVILLDNSADELSDWQGVQSARKFVPADYVLVWEALLAIRRSFLKIPGGNFLEWGSGFGIVTLMGQMLGWNASGIEIHSGLVEHARMHATDFDHPVQFWEGNLFNAEENENLPARFRVAKQELIYVYPWPDQELQIFDLFHRYATSGTYLLAYYGLEDIRLFRRS